MGGGRQGECPPFAYIQLSCQTKLRGCSPLSPPPSLLQGRICCKRFSSIFPICDDVISRILSKTVHFATYDFTVKEVLCDHSSVASFPSNKGHSPRHFSWPNLAQFQAFTGSKHRARIFKRKKSPGIDSKLLIPPAYVAWRSGTITLFLYLGS